MPRDTIYYHNFTEADAKRAIRYRWEMTPADVSVLTFPITYTAIGEEVVVSSEGNPAQFRDEYAYGLPDIMRHTVTLNLDNASSDFRSYILAPTGTAGTIAFINNFVVSDAVEYIDNYAMPYGTSEPNSLFVFETSNVWTLLTDGGDSELDESGFTVLFQGIQRRSESVKIIDGMVEILLEDIGTTILKTIQTNWVGYAMASNYISAVNYDELLASGEKWEIARAATSITAPKESGCFFDFLYKDGDDDTYAKIDLINYDRVRVVPISAENIVGIEIDRNYRHYLYWYKLTEFYDTLHRVMQMVHASFVRQPVANPISVTDNPMLCLTYYKQDYTPAAERGGALTTGDLYVMGWVEAGGATLPSYGYFHRDDGFGMARTHTTLYDWLNDHVESNGAYCRISLTTRTALSIEYRKPKNADGSPPTLVANSFHGDIDELHVEVGWGRLRGCTAVTHLDNNSVREATYSIPASVVETDYSISATLHATPTSLNDNDMLPISPGVRKAFSGEIWGAMPDQRRTFYVEGAFFSNKIGYFDTPSFSTTEFPFLPHRSVDYNNGATTISPIVDYTLPTQARSATEDAYKNFRESYAWQYIRAIVTDIQRQNNPTLAVAQGVVTTYASANLVRYEGETDIFADDGTPLFAAYSIGKKFTFSPTVIRSYFSNLPTSAYLIRVDPDYATGIAKVVLFAVP